jgi:lysozyme
MTLRERLILDEGLRLRLYVDGIGKWSIGVGRNLTDVGISQDEAMMMLDHDIEKAQSDLRMGWAPFVKLDQVRQDVLTNLCFNVGFHGLLLFKHMLAACAQGNYTLAAAEIRNSHIAPARRERLAQEMETGVEYV